MIATVPVTTTLSAAILGFLGATLTINVIAIRVRNRIDAGARASHPRPRQFRRAGAAGIDRDRPCRGFGRVPAGCASPRRGVSGRASRERLRTEPLACTIAAATIRRRLQRADHHRGLSLAPLGGRGITLERDDFPLSKTGIHVSGSCSGDRQEHARRRQLLFAAIVAESGITPNSTRRALFPLIPSTPAAGRRAS
jgi:hypothetical protein